MIRIGRSPSFFKWRESGQSARSELAVSDDADQAPDGSDIEAGNGISRSCQRTDARN